MPSQPLSEVEVYLGAKAWLISHGWTILGGQPPDGCDSLPVIEIKDSKRKVKGSIGAYKPDLVAFRGGTIGVVECKPAFDLDDAMKVLAVIGSDSRRAALFSEIRQRHLMERRGLPQEELHDSMGTMGILAHSSSPPRVQVLFQLVISDVSGKGLWHDPSSG